jgi:F-type H+-transporting ATPase subunit epsilon
MSAETQESPASPPPTPGRLRVGVVTPEGSSYDGEARSAVLPLHDGEVSFLPGHAAFLGAVGVGLLRVDEGGGKGRRWYVEGGVVQVLDDVVTVLAEQVVLPEKLDLERARQDLEAALALVPTTPEAFQARDGALASARSAPPAL